MKTVISEIVGGIAASAILVACVNSGFLDPSWMLLFHLLNIIGAVSASFTVPYASITYIVGWLFGLGIMSYSGLVGISDLLVYLIPLLIILVTKISKSISS